MVYTISGMLTITWKTNIGQCNKSPSEHNAMWVHNAGLISLLYITSDAQRFLTHSLLLWHQSSCRQSVEIRWYTLLHDTTLANLAWSSEAGTRPFLLLNMHEASWTIISSRHNNFLKMEKVISLKYRMGLRKCKLWNLLLVYGVWMKNTQDSDN